jgi:AraC family transcriptional regulator
VSTLPEKSVPPHGRAEQVDRLDISRPTQRSVIYDARTGIILARYFGTGDGGWTDGAITGFGYDGIMLTRGSNHTVNLDLNDVRYVIEPYCGNRLSCIPAGSSGKVHFKMEANIASLLLFPPGRLTNMMPEGTGASLTPIVMTDDEQMCSIFEMIEHEITTANVEQPGHIETLCRALAGYLASFSTQEAAERGKRLAIAPSRLKRVLDFVDENLANPIGLADMAAVAELSPYHFGRVFKHATGKSPYQHLIYWRIARSQILLAGTERSIVDIAAACGFLNKAHFSTAFSRQTGMSPSRYRAAIASSET